MHAPMEIAKLLFSLLILVLLFVIFVGVNAGGGDKNQNNESESYRGSVRGVSCWRTTCKSHIFL